MAPALNNLGLMYQQEGNLTKARPLLERSLAVREKALGPDHPDVGRALNNLAVLSQEEGDLVEAERMYPRAIAICSEVSGRAHPLCGAGPQQPRGGLSAERRDGKAGPAYDEALSIRRAALGPIDPDMSRALTKPGHLFDVTGRMNEAIRLQTESADIVELNLGLILATGSEVQKLRYMETLTENTDITVSMYWQSAPQNATAERLALTTLLRRKGRVLDAVSGSLQTLRDRLSPDDRLVLDKLSGRAASSQRWRCAGQAVRIRKRLQTTSVGWRRRFNGSNGTSAPGAPSFGRSPVRSRSRRSKPRSRPTQRSWSSHSTARSTTGSRSATSDLALPATSPTSFDGRAGRPPSISAMRRQSIVRWKRCDRCCGIPGAQVLRAAAQGSTERSCDRFRISKARATF